MPVICAKLGCSVELRSPRGTGGGPVVTTGVAATACQAPFIATGLNHSKPLPLLSCQSVIVVEVKALPAERAKSKYSPDEVSKAILRVGTSPGYCETAYSGGARRCASIRHPRRVTLGSRRSRPPN